MGGSSWVWNDSEKRYERGTEVIRIYHDALEGFLAYSTEERLVVCRYVVLNENEVAVVSNGVYQLRPTPAALAVVDAELIAHEFQEALPFSVRLVPPHKTLSVRDALRRKRELQQEGTDA